MKKNIPNILLNSLSHDISVFEVEPFILQGCLKMVEYLAFGGLSSAVWRSGWVREHVIVRAAGRQRDSAMCGSDRMRGHVTIRARCRRAGCPLGRDVAGWVVQERDV